MAFCGNCGFKVPEGMKFCPKCGTATIDLNYTNISLEEEEIIDLPIEDWQSKPRHIRRSEPVMSYIEKDQETRETKRTKKKRSIPWMIAGIISLAIAIAGFIYLSLAVFDIITEFQWVTFLLSGVAIAFGILSLVNRGKLRAFPIVALVIIGITLSLSIMHIVRGNANVPDQQVLFGDFEYSIPGYYEKADLESDERYLYVVENGNSSAILLFINVNMYVDTPEYASFFSNNEALVNQNMDLINKELDEVLEECIMSGLNNINARQISFVSNGQMGDLNTKKYSFNSYDERVGDAHGLCVGSFDIYTGNCYSVVLVEPDSS